MKLERFTGLGIHGFLNFRIKFNNDLTFLTGINGSGKTTVLNAIVALITPSLKPLADLSYTSIKVEFENEKKKLFVEASNDGTLVKVRTSETTEEFSFSRFIREDVPTSREADYEQE